MSQKSPKILTLRGWEAKIMKDAGQEKEEKGVHEGGEEWQGIYTETVDERKC